ncbi:hypothetical protein BATDEDRAFT_85196 [Batrachochytrium dendrobatidis JAM81]|uniref:ADF-H domain-containing protein n=1 Tax=Batrachochytrium dendrobatidis (strain JAM81 / FGSC 10211) TaxID=684364 RepID=F4NVD9_BATDJ|nr:uncharacterized protein BATDEDRAFT_85196 [Batrachochytrium dendrobatidis JAM81]EGF83682.1 hypothetical protein BATDEDRAFT_85196 [Batrachochytrium dendrobatidis JAM81]|eukprot:XP_006676188.1 hypothetical protein BATDEDRAFT_85196 [Batrachochytrium dendrobatidis JAM81]
MTHQSGIRPAAELVSLFCECNTTDNKVRAICSKIVNESINVTGTIHVSGTWEKDFEKLGEWLQESTPCYIMYRTDSRINEMGSYEWVFMQFVPDTAKVRDKMLYAASKSTLTKELGDSNFVDTVYATTKDDLSLEGFHCHVKHSHAEAPLTERELEAAAVKASESTAEIGISSRRSNAPGVAFQFTLEANQAFKELKNGSINFISLRVDPETETMLLDCSASIQLSEIHGKIDSQAPRFIFFKSVSSDDYAFAYVSPPECKVKERMLFAASRSYVVGEAEAILGLGIKAKFEVDTVDEFVSSFEDHCKQVTEKASPSALRKPAFAKPNRPGRK